jgi:fucose permease
MVTGYLAGIVFIPKYISQSKALLIVSVIAVVGSLSVVLMPQELSIYFVVLMALGCSLMWPAIWPLAMTDLGRFTKTGSSLMVIAIVGGALIPPLYGVAKDALGAQNAYWIAVPIFFYILYYALKGHKIRV